MYKEFIIVILVIILIVTLDILTNNYTKDSVDIMIKDLANLRHEVINENKAEAFEQIEKVKIDWEKRNKVLAYYIEHDELEKVETQLTELSANLDVEEYKHAISKLDTMIFILEHIEEKEKFDIQSIF